MARKTISDEGHGLTDRQLARLQKRIEEEYRKASEDVADVAEQYFKKFKKRDADMLKKVQSGEVSEKQYKEWRLAQIGRGERLEAMSAKAAQRMVDADKVAMQYVSDTLPSVYALNRNYAAYTIALSGNNIDYTLWNESTVKRLLKDKPVLMPNYPLMNAITNGYKIAYGQRQITDCVTSGILRGLSIPQMTSDLMKRIPGMGKTSAIRAARTAVTSAENAGRVDQYQDAVNQGIEMEQEWMCTLDGRTRDSHRRLDGEHVKIGKKFSNGCRYPADPQGKAGEVYNCRCTLVAWFPELKESNDARVTYKDWEKGKRAEIDKLGDKYVINDIVNKYDLNSIKSNGRISARVSDENTHKLIKYNENYDYSISIPRYSDEVNSTLSYLAKTLSDISFRDGVEYSALIDVKSGKLVQHEKGVDEQTGTDFYSFLEKNKNDKFIFFHTHVYDGAISGSDMEVLLTCDNIDCVIACRVDSVQYVAPKKSGGGVHKLLFMIYGDLEERDLVKRAIEDYTDGFFEKDGRI